MAQGPDDRPRPLVMLGVLAALALVGFVVTRATFEHDRSVDETSAQAAPEVEVEAAARSPEPRAAEQPAPTPEAATPSPAPVPVPVPVEDASIAAVAPSGSSTAASGTGTLTRGRIAYIRCEGVPQLAGPNPCPRDQAIERAVWTAIERLPACAPLRGKRGASDVRVVFDAGALAGLGFRDLDSPELDRDAVRGCLEPALTGLRTSRPGARITASFRFDVE